MNRQFEQWRTEAEARSFADSLADPLGTLYRFSFAAAGAPEGKDGG